MKQKNENLNEQEIMIANKGIAKQMEREILIDVYGVDGENEVELEKMSEYMQRRNDLIWRSRRKYYNLGHRKEILLSAILGIETQDPGPEPKYKVRRRRIDLNNERIGINTERGGYVDGCGYHAYLKLLELGEPLIKKMHEVLPKDIAWKVIEPVVVKMLNRTLSEGEYCGYLSRDLSVQSEFDDLLRKHEGD